MNASDGVDILLVEDNPRDAELTLRTLRKHRLANNVVHLKAGQEALDWLFGTAAHAPSGAVPRLKLVLLDLKLPRVDGLQVLRVMRKDARTSHVPVVVLTSSHEERDVVESYKLGVNSYIVKPVDFEGFSAAVAEAGHYWLLVNHAPSP